MHEDNNIQDNQVQPQITNSVQEISNIEESKQFNLSNDKPKSNGFLVTLLSVLLLIACFIAGFFAYQTQTLVKELTEIKNNQQPTPVTVSKPTDLPIATESGVVTGTKDWKVYTDPEWNFTFKYPETGSVSRLLKRDDLLVGGATFKLNYKDGITRPQASEIYINIYDSKNMDLNTWLVNNSTTEPFGSEENKEFYGYLNQGNIDLLDTKGVRFKKDVMGFVSNNVAIKNGNYIYVIGDVKVSDDLSSTFSKILSTFEFTD